MSENFFTQDIMAQMRWDYILLEAVKMNSGNESGSPSGQINMLLPFGVRGRWNAHDIMLITLA